MNRLDISIKIKQLLIDTLSLDIREEELSDDTLLLGNLPEFDSMAIVSILTALEEDFDFIVEDDDLSADAFESINSLVDFVQERI
ncbi:acyl carrier protein [Aliikangiella sp. IMCC44359]|uniref:acyl carrier protein n=1 Tax=Aliikangiella sp. IMCC44359 TaxID=3459125 RepID=UPI00403AA754